ncbi:MAG: ATP-binding protein [Myxococcota bacterium]
MKATPLTAIRAGATVPRILCVDDEPHALAALSNSLRRQFDITTADSGAAAMRAIADAGPFAVIVSDYAMPGMNGAELLSRVRVVAPDTTRVLLTGHATLDGAIAAVNDGSVFRFLTKPCAQEHLQRALADAVEQARIVTADRALVERKLEAMAVQLVRAERLASLGTMAGAVGHELAHLLTVLDATLGELRRDAADAPPTPETLGTLGRVRDQLDHHARNLLHFGRPPAGGDAAADLGVAVAETVSLLRSAGVLAPVRLTIDVPTGPVPVTASRSEIEQVVVNLVKNAVDALTDGRHLRRTIHVQVTAAPPHGACAISDNGGGIGPALLPQIFEPYYTTKPPDRGTGLGLFVVRRIVARAGGDVAVQSEVGRGTTFTVRLPLR